LKKKEDIKKWDQINYLYMTDESTCSEDDVFNVRRLSWRSEGMYESKVISFIALKC